MINGSRHKLNWAERLTAPIRMPPGEGPPSGLWPFVLYFARQTGWLIPGIFVITCIHAIIDILMPVSFGWLIDRLVEKQGGGLTLEVAPWIIGGIIFLFLIGRPLTLIVRGALTELAMMTGFSNIVRWQSHWHVLDHDMGYFHNELAGRVAARVVDAGLGVRSIIMRAIDIFLYMIIYLAAAVIVLGQTSLLLCLPLLIWILGYLACGYFIMPKIRKRSREHSRLRSKMTGRIVDSYSNISTVKLFASKEMEGSGAAAAIDDFNFGWARVMRLSYVLEIMVALLNGALIVSTAVLAFYFASNGLITIGVLAASIPIVYRITEQSWILMWDLSWFFEHVGGVDDAQRTISYQSKLKDAPDAKALAFGSGEIALNDVTFNYGKAGGLFEKLNLVIKPGERVGLVGRSGAGKTSVVNLILRFFDPDGGAVLIDGQDIRTVSQESLRSHIGVVTQDPGLLHRTIADNILYGRPDATQEMLEAAADKAQALDFIRDLVDQDGNAAFDAEIGERGVKLSGGQRQRLALARVILKDAPILILDEATSALDSEVEAAIQEQLDELLENRTTIAIAHRLSTIAQMDRLVVMDQGRIIEEGTHEELLALEGGHYAKLWSLQSGGFIGAD